MMGMRLREFLETGDVVEMEGSMDRPVAGLAYDSRKVKKEHIFFAVPGTHADGHQFAPDAVKRGAAAVVVERKTTLPKEATWIRVSSVRRTMGRWAALFFAYPSRRVDLVGITGTNGKTTVTYLVESIFAAAGMEPGVVGTINYRYRGRVFPSLQTTPESVDLQALFANMVQAGVRSVTMEVSSHALAMERVRGADFDGAVFTNLSRDHLDFHRDMDDYFSAKSKLFADYLGASSKKKKFAIIHGGDRWGERLLGQVREAGLEVLSYGSDRKWDIHPTELKEDLDGLRGKILVRGQELEFSSRLVGAANLENIMAAVGVGFALGLPPGAIAGGIASLESVPGRLQKIKNGLGITVLVDYAHTPDALERVLSALKPLARRRLIALFGCGGDRDRGKRPIMGEIAARLGDMVVLTSDNPRTEEPLKILEEIEEGVRKTGIKKLQVSDLKSQMANLQSEILNLKSYFVEPDRRAAIGLALRLARAGDIVLMAGKGHEDYQILGAERVHFDDREVVREELSALSDQRSGRADG